MLKARCGWRVALAEYWLLRGDFTEGREYVHRALQLSAGQPTARASALYGAAILANNHGDHDMTLALAQESLALAESHGEALDRLRARMAMAEPLYRLRARPLPS